MGGGALRRAPTATTVATGGGIKQAFGRFGKALPSVPHVGGGGSAKAKAKAKASGKAVSDSDSDDDSSDDSDDPKVEDTATGTQLGERTLKARFQVLPKGQLKNYEKDLIFLLQARCRGILVRQATKGKLAEKRAQVHQARDLMLKHAEIMRSEA